MIEEYNTASPAETEAFGEALAKRCARVPVIAMYGDLGSGKTALVRGLARGMGCLDPVSSPTYNIVNEYRGPRKVCHFVLYRLADAEGLWEIGWEDYLLSGALCVLEWSERFDEPFPEGTVYLRFEKTGENSRRIRVEGAENLC